MKSFGYFEPPDVDSALVLLGKYKGQAKILAGGTDLVPQMKRGLCSPGVIINLARISSLGQMRQSTEGLHIGAMVSLGTLERSPLLASGYPALQEAVSHVAVRSIRNAGTIGGNVCLDTKCIYRDQAHTWKRTLDPCFKSGGGRCYVIPGGKACHASLAADTVPLLIALQAKAKVFSPSGERISPLETLYTGNGIRPLALAPEEILAEISLPPPGNNTGAAYFRFSPRQAIDFPMVSAAVWVKRKEGVCTGARVVLGGVAPGPLRLVQTEALAKGGRASEELFRRCSEQAPEEALRISHSGRIDGFARNMTSSLVYRGLKKAWPMEG